jgi:hypothetical protein
VAMALDLGIAICKLRLRPTTAGGGIRVRSTRGRGGVAGEPWCGLIYAAALGGGA